ncbi:PAS domain S-box-containing protein/diguanylate cyclase (GGDEF)-like protein [Microvirgula sp. AG722]|uniref:Sensor domain-containing diguanylate cyclase n=1 Tax=Microvirgula aerodenitrificans TaxID=57480 RepID=A0A2S0P6U5_9NEIS|nr:MULTISPECIES: sensor domain-containing diguanylate cyclase [Microvirgula]AVY93119.1 hypothetical protein DAI18_02975 [Microvirgula aerodenitrificans]RAS12640.1 PAS domain S-box-containing protein/diguanylate cyclase (GGDEF)-like protein [Microvirgula sp. AG722]
MRVSWLRASLRTRLVVLGLMVNLTLAGMLTAVALLSWQSLLQQDLHARGDAISGLLDSGLAALLAKGDHFGIYRFAESGVESRSISFLVVRDAAGHVLVHTAPDDRSAQLAPMPVPDTLYKLWQAGPVLALNRDIHYDGRKVGSVQFGLPLEDIRTTFYGLLLRCLAISSLGVVGLLLLQHLLRCWISEPIEGLVLAAKRMARGESGGLLPRSGPPEVMALSESFARMRESLDERMASMRIQQDTLNAIADHTYAWELWFDPQGRVVWVNPSVERITGHTVEQCLQSERYLLDMVSDIDRDRVSCALRTSLADRKPGQGFQFRVRHKSGANLWVLASWTPIFAAEGQYLGIRVSLLDCTESLENRRALEQAVSRLRVEQLRASQHLRDAQRERAMLDTLLASLYIGLVFVDGERRVLYANPLFSQFWGLPQLDELAGHVLEEFLPSLAELLHGHSGEVELKLDDGRIVLVRLSPIEGDGDSGSLLLCEDVTAARASAEQLVFLAERDTLTGIFNRRRFQLEIERMVKQSERSQRSMALLTFDLNDFKLVNDNHGHAAGDMVLIDIARVINRTIRQSELFCRLGGDEFAVLLPEADVFDASMLAGRIDQHIREIAFDFSGIERRVSASIGIAIFPDHAATADELVAAADAAMYDAKKDDENGCWRIFDGATMQASLTFRPPHKHDYDGRNEPTVIV